ncbi:MAG: hypothetical protein ACREB9_08275 [Thermoplasmata archaeon]
MPPRRREIEISIERPLSRGAAAGEGIVRLSERLEFDEGKDGPPVDEIKEAFERLRRTSATLAIGEPRADRSTEELIETYRPRQPELLELLRDEGELTATEFERLRAHLETGGPPRAQPTAPALRPARVTVPAERPSAGPPATARSVDALIRLYRIESLRQAGIIRARREISFDEYMSLKRHFESLPSRAP